MNSKTLAVFTLFLLFTIPVMLIGCLADADRENVVSSTDAGKSEPNDKPDPGNNSEPGDKPDPGGNPDPSILYYWDSDIAPILDVECHSCHGVTPFENSLSLTSSNYSGIVDQPAPSGAPFLLIDTVNGSGASYIYMKATGATGISGNPMSYLTDEQETMLQHWIDQSPSAPETSP